MVALSYQEIALIGKKIDRVQKKKDSVKMRGKKEYINIIYNWKTSNK